MTIPLKLLGYIFKNIVYFFKVANSMTHKFIIQY